MEVTSGTTCPPTPSLVAHRGEWRLGTVFDIYWLFAEAVDCYYAVFFNTALAIYLIIMDDTFRDGKEKVFFSPKAQDSSASHKYCYQVK